MTPNDWYQHMEQTKAVIREVGIIAYLKIVLRWATETGLP